VIANAVAWREGKPWLDEVLGYLDGNRQLVGEMLEVLLPDVTYRQPDGTYLAWLDFAKSGLGPRLDVFFRENARVAIVDGGACGDIGQGAVRFNFAMPRPILQEAIERMAAAVNGR
jgi:cystathionine beta-lyase